MAIKISKQQLDSRWDLMPEILRGAMTSQENSDIVWKTAENEHLAEEKIFVVSRLVGYVLMGFIHPEELANEIKNSLGIDARIASAIAEPINKKVFQPVQEELEQIYAPAGEEPHMPQPVVLEEIIKPAAVPAPAPSPLSQMPKPKTETSPVAMPVAPVKIPAPMPAPAISSQAAAPAPSPAAAPVYKPAERQLPVNMFSRMPGSAVKPLQEKTTEESKAIPVAEKPAPAVMPQENQPAVEQTPFMLHQESESEPLSPAKSAFKVGLSQEQFGKMEQKWAAPPRAAQIETGSTNSPQASIAEESVQKPPAKDQRVVHYGEMKTPLPPVSSEKNQSSEESGNPFEILRRNGNNSR